MIFLNFKTSSKESPFLKMSEEFRERCLKRKKKKRAELESEHKNEVIQSGSWGKTLVINTVFQVNTVLLLARRKQDLDISSYTITNT